MKYRRQSGLSEQVFESRISKISLRNVYGQLILTCRYFDVRVYVNVVTELACGGFVAGIASFESNNQRGADASS